MSDYKYIDDVKSILFGQLNLNIVDEIMYEYYVNRFGINYICNFAASIGDLHLLIWLKEIGYLCNCNKNDAYKYASVNGRLEILMWLNENNYPIDYDVVYLYASANGYLEILKWVKKYALPNNFLFCSCAAQFGHINAFKWLRENNCPWNECICSIASQFGHFEILKWARKNGCPWDKSVCENAVIIGHLEMLCWIRENNCPWDEAKCIDLAIKNGHTQILHWLQRLQKNVNHYYKQFGSYTEYLEKSRMINTLAC